MFHQLLRHCVVFFPSIASELLKFVLRTVLEIGVPQGTLLGIFRDSEESAVAWSMYGHARAGFDDKQLQPEEVLPSAIQARLNADIDDHPFRFKMNCMSRGFHVAFSAQS